VREPPSHVTDAAVLEVVRDRWLPEVDAVEHLPVGFGAWHWQATAGGAPRLFVTLDSLGTHHTADSLEATYAAAATLGIYLDAVVAPLPDREGSYTAALGGDALSATLWVVGTSADGAATPDLVRRLHAVSPPRSLVHWSPLVEPDLPERLAARTLTPWTAGPHGEEARVLLHDHLDDVAAWTADYLRLAATTDPATWVTTHGEPHARNQLVTAGGVRLLDWESARLAPAERDLRWLAPSDTGGDPELLRMFDLEWRLDEVSQYADWFERPHTGTESDRVALGGLRSALEP
jgi:spectinomycin phosphotransferase